MGFPIRKSAGQRVFAPHRSLSQRTTSFIASQRQGIHQMPLGHLISLIFNAHSLGRVHARSGKRAIMGIGEKTSFTWINPSAFAVKLMPAQWRRFNSKRLRPIPYSRCQTNQRHRTDPGRNLCFMCVKPKVVEPDGIEPTTSCLQSTRSPN